MNALSFPSFQSHLLFEYSNFSIAKCNHWKDVENMNFIHGINIVIPNTLHLPKEINWPSDDYVYYMVEKLPLSVFISKEFLEAFVRKGKFYGLSMGGKIDLDNCVAFLPTGQLILNIDKDTYEELGLQGKPSIFNGKNAKKYVVEIDVNQSYFTPGRKGYDRVAKCFANRPDLLFNYLIHWYPNDDKICPSSVASYFQSKGSLVRQCSLKSTKAPKYSTPVPKLSSAQWDDCDENYCNYKEFYEWAGSLQCNIDCSEPFCDEYVSSFTTPTPNEIVGQTLSCNWRGFIPSTEASELIKSIRSTVNSQNEYPWALVTLLGFDDSPVSWKNDEHGFLSSGDILLTYVIFPDGHYWKYKALSSHDIIR